METIANSIFSEHFIVRLENIQSRCLRYMDRLDENCQDYQDLSCIVGSIEALLERC